MKRVFYCRVCRQRVRADVKNRAYTESMTAVCPLRGCTLGEEDLVPSLVRSIVGLIFAFVAFPIRKTWRAATVAFRPVWWGVKVPYHVWCVIRPKALSERQYTLDEAMEVARKRLLQPVNHARLPQDVGSYPPKEMAPEPPRVAAVTALHKRSTSFDQVRTREEASPFFGREVQDTNGGQRRRVVDFGTAAEIQTRGLVPSKTFPEVSDRYGDTRYWWCEVKGRKVCARQAFAPDRPFHLTLC